MIASRVCGCAALERLLEHLRTPRRCRSARSPAAPRAAPAAPRRRAARAGRAAPRRRRARAAGRSRRGAPPDCGELRSSSAYARAAGAERDQDVAQPPHGARRCLRPPARRPAARPAPGRSSCTSAWRARPPASVACRRNSDEVAHQRAFDQPGHAGARPAAANGDVSSLRDADDALDQLRRQRRDRRPARAARCWRPRRPARRPTRRAASSIVSRSSSSR